MMGMFGNVAKKYNTPIPESKKAGFAQWLANLPEYQRGSEDYDMQGAFLAGLGRGGNGHFPDTFKKPNHMTFSDESIYSTPQNQGGKWVPTGDGNYVFWASPANLGYNSATSISDYFRRNEPGQTVVLPIDWRLK